MKYVLIWMFLTNTPMHGAIEFSSNEACFNASEVIQQALERAYDDVVLNKNLFIYCMRG